MHYALLIAKDRMIISTHRFVMSSILFIPVVGIFLYHLFKNSLREKKFKFFSDEFVDRMYSIRKYELFF